MSEEFINKIEESEKKVSTSHSALAAFMAEGFQIHLIQILKLVIIGWIITIIIAIIAYQVNDERWRQFLSQYEIESYSLSTDGGGNASYIGQDGDIYNGTSESPKACEKEGNKG